MNNTNTAKHTQTILEAAQALDPRVTWGSAAVVVRALNITRKNISPEILECAVSLCLVRARHGA